MAQLLLETERTAKLNQVINDFFEQSIADATDIDPSYRQLWETLYGLIQSGGKRLRPFMTLLAYEAFGGKNTEKMISVAAAQELLHFCLLIHDDVIDRDYIRYGVPNVAGRYKEVYSKFVTDVDDQKHYAHGAAILGGDLILSGAHQLIASSDLDSKQKMIAQQLLSRSIFEVAGGELLDTESSFVPYTAGDALKIAKYKTASYSFISPLMTGARLATISSEQITALHTYALSLGIAYQLVDDLLGVFGNTDETGKSTSSDITEGKRTFMVEQAMSVMTASDKTVFDNAFGNPKASSSEIQQVKQILESTGARSITEQAVTDYADKAHRALAELSLDEQYHTQFDALIRKVTERSF